MNAAITMINVTIVNNSAIGGTPGAAGAGGAAGTPGVAAGGGIFSDSTTGSFTLKNTIVAANSVSGPLGAAPVAPDFDGPVTASDHNLIGNNTGSTGFGLAGSGDVVNPANPNLGQLQTNGGGTSTVALLTGSPAIDAGDNTAATAAGLTTDQRGGTFARIVNGTVDIGAFEVQTPPSSAATAVPVDLSSVFNLVGIGSDGHALPTGQMGLDGFGETLSGSQLGTSLTLQNGISFNIAAAAAGNATNNVVAAQQQTITLSGISGTFSAIEILATGVDGNQPGQTFTITYMNGTQKNVSLNISDWFTPQSYFNETIARQMPYRNLSNGTSDPRRFDVYAYALDVNDSPSALAVKSVTLPNNSHVDILAMTLVPLLTAPNNLTATVASHQINLSWTPPVGPIPAGIGVAGYNVYRGTTSGGELSTPINSLPLPPSQLTYNDTNVAAGNTYFYQVRAVNGAAFGPPSNEVSAKAEVTGQPTPVDLTASFNQVGIAADGTSFSQGGLDGFGDALSATQMGTGTTLAGVPFNFGPTSSSNNLNNVVLSKGQTIGLPSGNFSQVQILATATNGNQSASFAINSSGGSKTFAETVGDWFSPTGAAGQTVALATPYRNLAAGGRDQRYAPAIGTAGTFDIYLFTFNVDPSLTVSSITLPNNSNVQILAVTAVP